LLNAEDRTQIPLASPKPVFVRSVFINIDEQEDNLNLSAYIDEQLDAISSKGSTSTIIFVDAKQYPDGCKVSGIYSQIGSQWHLKGKLKCGEEETAFQIISPTIDELKQLLLGEINKKIK